MKKILVLKTSMDGTMFRLFDELQGKHIDCLIQSSEMNKYQKKFPNINFIDIENEGFYELTPHVLRQATKERYDEIYITFSGVVGHHYGNVIEVLDLLRFKKAFFYNCNGERVNIPRQNLLRDWLCREFISFIQFVH